MSTTSIPRHVARKSTVSRSMPSNTFIIADQSTIEQSIILLPDLETEQMLVDDQEETIADLVEDLLHQVEEQVHLDQLHQSFQSEMSMEESEEVHASSQCTCACHQHTHTDDEFLRFEQALEQTRQEEQWQRTKKNTDLLQVLKEQHDALMTFYLKQIQTKKVDQEQQTSPLACQDFQGQTDLPAPTVVTRPSTAVTGTSPRSFTNTFLTPISTIGPALQDLIPCLTTVPRAAPRPTAGTLSHEVVDLTIDDDDEQKKKTHAKSLSARPSAPGDGSTSVQIPALPNSPSCDHSIGRPHLSVSQDPTTVQLTWNLFCTSIESIQHYEIFASKRTMSPMFSDWKKIGSVKSMRLPIAVSLKEFQANSHYVFAIRAVSIDQRFGPFSEPKLVLTSPTSTQPLQTSHLLNQS